MPQPETTAEAVIAAEIEIICSDGNSDRHRVARGIISALDAAGFALAIKMAPGELMPHQKAEAAIDRHHAMKGRIGYEKHPNFREGLK